MIRILVLLIALLFVLPVAAKQDGKGKGHAAGGVRSEHVSEMGDEKGKAWAGTKESEDKEDSDSDSEDDDGDKKDKKEKKEKKDEKDKKAKKGKKSKKSKKKK